MTPQTPAERIRQRRTQILVHSYLYYELDDPIIDDHTWQRWADELVELQRQHPGSIGFLDAVFADWDGSTGAHLPRDSWTRQNALRLRAIHERNLSRPAAEKAPPAPAPQAPSPLPPAAPVQASLF
jgi:hypothetical protein